MLLPFLCKTLQDEAPARTHAIYRCSRAEAESNRFGTLVREGGYDAFCVEPAPGPNARQAVAKATGTVRFVPGQSIDTAANLRWRNALIAFANGTISPKAWVARSKGLHETVHFLSNPKAPSLRRDTGNAASRAVLAEMLVLTLPGRPCLTADDTAASRTLPPAGPLRNWILAMNDHLGPMLYARAENQAMVDGPVTFLRADAKPGLLVFTFGRGDAKRTVYLNNAAASVDLPKVDLDAMGIALGLDAGGPTPRLMSMGFLILAD